MEDQKNKFQIPTSRQEVDSIIDCEQNENIHDISKIRQGLGLASEALMGLEIANKDSERLYDIASKIDRERKEKINQSEKKAA